MVEQKGKEEMSNHPHPGLELPVGDEFIPLRYHNTVRYLDSEGNQRKIPEGEILLVIVDVSSPKEKKQKICSAIFIDGKFRVGLFLKTYQPWRIKAVKRTGQKIDPPKLPATLPEIRSNIFVSGLPENLVYKNVPKDEASPVTASTEETYLIVFVDMTDTEKKKREEMLEIRFVSTLLLGYLLLLVFLFCNAL